MNAAPLGRMLVERKLLNEEQLRIALLEQAQASCPLGKVLLNLGFVDELPLFETLADQSGTDLLSPDALTPEAEVSTCLPSDISIVEQVLPLRLSDTATSHPCLEIACSTPNDLLKQDRLRRHLPNAWRLHMLLAPPNALDEAITRYQPMADPMDACLSRLETLDAGQTDGPAIVALANALLRGALELRASDIHCEPGPSFLQIRLRIDGQMRPYRLLRKPTWTPLLVRLKILGELDISETRQAQDGRMSFPYRGRNIDVRMSTLPTLQGESLVLRLLDRNKGIRPLDQLGLPAQAHAQILHLLNRPEGLILLTGPTGSGKTTTLYALLQHLQSDRISIMTLEDPVEYTLPGIQQTLVDPPRLDFAQGVRALLRQDPDVLLIGEIRDEQTAQMALRATQTGHQVFSTLHASDPFSALQRLQQLGIPLPALRGCLTAIINQRLVRKICPHCAEPMRPSEHERHLFGLGENTLPGKIYQPQGCVRCQGSGYLGRVLLLEIVPYCDTQLEPLLTDADLPRTAQMALARQAGWRSLAEQGVQLVLSGMTSLAELQTAVALPPTL